MQGLETWRVVQKLVDIIQAHGPKIMFFLETWFDKKQMEKVHSELEFVGLFIISNDGRGSGLALLWKSETAIWVDNFSNYHIDVIVNGGPEDA